MGFLCAPEGPAKGERLRAQPPHGGLCSGQAAPAPGVCAGGKPPPAGRSGVAGTGGAAAEVAAGDLPCGRPRTLHQPAEIMRMHAKKCEIVSKPAAICGKPDLLIV